MSLCLISTAKIEGAKEVIGFEEFIIRFGACVKSFWGLYCYYSCRF